MNSKQRILTALNNEQPDRVPICDWIDESVIINLAKILGFDTQKPKTVKGLLQGEESFEILDLYCVLVQELGLDATWFDFSRSLERISDDLVRDKYGRLYCLSEHGSPMVVEGPIKEPSDMKGYDMVAKLEPDDFARARYIIDEMGKDRAHIMSLDDPFKESWLLRGSMTNLFMDYVLNPGLVHALARIATNFDIAVIDAAAEIGVDVIMMDGDLASERTTLISPKHYREYVKVYQREIVEYAQQRGLRIIKHSDGNVWPILDDFVEVGFDGFHPVQPQSMNIVEVKERLAGKACILGNIDCRNLLPFGTEEEVEEAVKETIEKAAPEGGYIITSSNSIHAGCKPENYIAMVQAAHRYGVYS